MEPFIKINGRPFPYPKRGLELLTSTFVDSARNTAGQVVSQKVGRDQYKINRCEWPVLDAEQWSMMLSMLDDFFVDVTFPDPVHNTWRTLRMYPGDRSAEPYFLDETTGLPTLYRNCKVNLIDAGYEDTTPLPVPPQYRLQSKTVTAQNEKQVVKPDLPAYYGLSEVTVLPKGESSVIEQSKAVTLSDEGVDGTYRYVIDPSVGYTSMKAVEVTAKTEAVTVVPNKNQQIIKPSKGFMGIISVTVEAIDPSKKTVETRYLLLRQMRFKTAPDGAGYSGYWDLGYFNQALDDAYVLSNTPDLTTSNGQQFLKMGLYAVVSPDRHHLMITSIQSKPPTSDISIKLVLIWE